MSHDVLPALIHEDRTREWKVADLADMESDGKVEIYDGVLQVSPWAALGHQRLGTRLAGLLNDQLPPPAFAVSEAGALLSPDGSRFRIPDVMVLADYAPSHSGCAAAKDILLVAEIASPASIGMDRIVKRREYGQAGIPIYLTIDPDPIVITVLVLAAGGPSYLPEGPYTSGDTIRIDALPFPLSIDVAALAV